MNGLVPFFWNEQIYKLLLRNSTNHPSSLNIYPGKQIFCILQKFCTYYQQYIFNSHLDK